MAKRRNAPAPPASGDASAQPAPKPSPAPLAHALEQQHPQADSNAAPEPRPQQPAQPSALEQQPAAASGPDSNAAPPSLKQETAGHALEQATQTSSQDAGNVPNSTPALDAKALTAARAHVRERLQQHPDWPRIVATIREMRGSLELASMTTEARERFIWGEMDRLYPPAKAAETATVQNLHEAKPLNDNDLRKPAETNRVNGLGDIPPTWPPLPANAALPAELGWVQANRLYVVEELASGGTRVHLDRAHEAAPSRSAIGWLETSIRSYAKFVEVAAKVTGAGDDEGEHMKRERMAIDEIRGLLAEMAGNPVGPGR